MPEMYVDYALAIIPCFILTYVHNIHLFLTFLLAVLRCTTHVRVVSVLNRKVH